MRSLHRIARLLDARAYLHVLERLVLLPGYRCRSPQLFILGLPRSGTTLVYQYVVHRLAVAYFTNGVGQYPRSPCVVTLVQARIHARYRSDFKSRYGRVAGPVAPREAGGFWGRFFGFEEYVRFEDLKPADVCLLRNTIACVQATFGDAPFVNKNVKHMLRIDALAKVFPAAHFMLVERSLEDIALSVLRARYDNSEDPRAWWSVKPPDYPRLRELPLIEQIAQQLVCLRTRMEADLASITTGSLLRVSYEDFCASPEDLIGSLRPRLGPVPYRNGPVPHFPRSVNVPNTREECQLVELVRALAGHDGDDTEVREDRTRS